MSGDEVFLMYLYKKHLTVKAAVSEFEKHVLQWYTGREVRIFPSPQAYIKKELGIFASPRVYLEGESYILQLASRFARCFVLPSLRAYTGRRAYIGGRVKTISSYLPDIYSYFLCIFSYFQHFI